MYLPVHFQFTFLFFFFGISFAQSLEGLKLELFDRWREFFCRSVSSLMTVSSPLEDSSRCLDLADISRYVEIFPVGSIMSLALICSYLK